MRSLVAANTSWRVIKCRVHCRSGPELDRLTADNKANLKAQSKEKLKSPIKPSSRQRLSGVKKTRRLVISQNVCVMPSIPRNISDRCMADRGRRVFGPRLLGLTKIDEPQVTLDRPAEPLSIAAEHMHR
jgi:hypothetical protein